MSKLFRWTAIVLTVLGLGFSAASSAFNAVLVPAAVWVGVGFSALAIAVAVVLLRLLPSWPRGAGPWWVVLALSWGGGTCMLYPLVAANGVMRLSQATTGDLFAFSWAGAYPEEIAKAVGVAVVCLSFRRLNRPWHALLVGFVIGLGFEVSENILYGAMGALYDPTSDLSGALSTWGMRSVAGPLLHACLTALSGWGVGWALFAARRSGAWRFATATSWVLIAFLLHFAWNVQYGSLTVQIVSFVVVSLIVYPLTAYMFVRAVRAAREDAGGVVVSDRLITSVDQLPAR